jgi:TRAP-type C4-dicarboxylate transport system substrate-binding protein
MTDTCPETVSQELWDTLTEDEQAFFVEHTKAHAGFWDNLKEQDHNMQRTFVFSTDFHISADSEEQARDGLLELLAELVRKDDVSWFDLIEEIDQ